MSESKKYPPTASRLLVLKTALFTPGKRAEVLAKIARETGDVVRIPLPGKQIFLVTHPRDVGRVLAGNAKNYVKSFDYRILEKFLGKGLLTSEGETWRRERRTIQPLFHRQAMESLPEAVHEATEIAMARWSDTQPIDVETEMTRITLKVIALRVFGDEIAAQADRMSEGMESAQQYITDLILAVVKPFWKTGRARKFEKTLSEIHAFIDERTALRRKSGVIAKGTLLDLLVSAKDPTTGEGLSDAQIRDQVVTLFMAGHETTALAMTWTLKLLAEHSEWQDRIRRDVDGSVLQAVLLESMRIYPPIALMGRESKEDDTLGGYFIPAGSTLLLSQYVTHRRADFWEEALRFNPERFLDLESSAYQEEKFAYFPFGGGPRVCIGNAFALMELKGILRLLLSRYRFVAADARELERITAVPFITLKPSHPVRLLARPI